MARRPPRTAPKALLWALALAGSGCDESKARIGALLEPILPETAGAKVAPPQAEPLPAPEVVHAAPDPANAAPALTERRYAGGRPIAWWSERLSKLRREGPADLYRITVDRARLNGLDVVEKDGGEIAVGLARAEARP